MPISFRRRLFAGFNQGVAVGIGCPAGGSRSGGKGPGRIRLHEFEGGIFLAENLSGNLDKGGGIALPHVGDAVVNTDAAVFRQFHLGNGRIGQPPAVPHGVKYRGQAHSSFFKGTGLRLPGRPLPPERMFFNLAQAGGDSRGLGQHNARAVFVPAPQGVFHAQFEGVHSQLFRQQIHHPFEGKAHLDDAETPHGSGNGIIGIKAPALNQRMGNAIRPPGMLHAQGHHFRAEMGVSAGIVIETAGERLERSVGCGAETVMHPGGMTLVSGNQDFLRGSTTSSRGGRRRAWPPEPAGTGLSRRPCRRKLRPDKGR